MQCVRSFFDTQSRIHEFTLIYWIKFFHASGHIVMNLPENYYIGHR